MTVAKNLDKASGLFFFGGFLISKLQYAPIPLLSAGFRFLSLGIYMIAYSLWLTANLLRPDHKQAQDKWYGFAQIKEQFFLSSFVGLCATIISVAALFVLPLFPLAAWLFLVGNTLWTIGEYHKLKNPPPNDDHFSYTRQSAYLSYAITTTSISLITAIAATLIVIFPPTALPITIFSLLISAGLGALSLEFWLNSTFGDHKPLFVPNSYNQMSDTLGPSASPSLSESPRPNHDSRLFNEQNVSSHPKSVELLSANNTIENINENGLEAVSSL